MKETSSASILHFILLGTISATVLAYEILLLRVFSYSQWHHFASFSIALALLGFGVAGTVLTLLGNRAVHWGDSLFVFGLLLGSTGMIFAFQISQWILVRPLFIVWDQNELLKLLFVDFVSFIPFFGFALAIGQVFVRWPRSTPRLYAVNLIGSGFGCLVAVVLLSLLHLEHALMLLPVGVLGFTTLFCICRQMWKATLLTCLLMIVGAVGWIQQGVKPLALSDFKQLSYLLDLPDIEILARHPGLRSEICILKSEHIRYSPGLSLHWKKAVPSQRVAAIGADLTFQLPENGEDTAHHQTTLGYLPYGLRPEGKVLWLGVSKWQTRKQGREIEWGIGNPHLVSIMKKAQLPENLNLVARDSRVFLDTIQNEYSIIVLTGAAEKADAAGEDYLLTAEGLAAGFSGLNDDGILVIPFPLSNPPQHAPKLMSLTATVLRDLGNGEPQEHIAFLRSMHTSMAILAKRPFSSQDLKTIRRFATKWGFDLVSLTGLQESDSNRFHRWESPVLFHASKSILESQVALPPEAAWFTLRVPRDHSPYFWRTVEWSKLAEMWQQMGRMSVIWCDWGIFLTVIKLVLSGIIAALLILLPLRWLRERSGKEPRRRILIYFAALGLGYMLVEMVVFQRCIRFLSDPVITASVVFTIFLIGSGIGSLSTPRSVGQSQCLRIFAPIILFGWILFFIMGPCESLLVGLPVQLRVVCIAFSTLPLAWAMGRAFPWGLCQLEGCKELIPWAWGINGFTSVLGAPTAVLLSVHYSQILSFGMGQVCYLLAAIMVLNKGLSVRSHTGK